ncbi:hydrocarbon-binding protein [Nostoc sp. CENA67]|uniref:Hydrocarbon-binding protein n=1 Tax=Amazonocrinis nigriterrae CENA67 TaxID=2794033 RepID=A0A8J7HYH7_9NOST|nr:hydrocarbon-binding protein [Amazonocrinis nigriterrae]MBH8565772.1 hydrocarbon-binding protein [Amazonocrinis nigriterrae CENA67]
MPDLLRKELGDFNSIVCFKSVIQGMEDALGEKATAIALTTAGRLRGKKLAEDLGLSGSLDSLDSIAAKLSLALGKEGTRLCIVHKIVSEGEVIKAYTSETVCLAGEAPNSERKCTFTMGAIWGALEQVLGHRFRGVHTESVLRGSNYDVFEFTPLG